MSTDLIWKRTTEDTEQIQRKKTALMWYRWNTSAHHTKHYWEVLGFRTSTGLASQGQTHSRKTYDLLTKIGSHLGRGLHVRWNPRQTRMASHLERPNQRPSPKVNSGNSPDARSPMFEASQRQAFCGTWKALKSVFGRGFVLDPLGELTTLFPDSTVSRGGEPPSFPFPFPTLMAKHF